MTHKEQRDELKRDCPLPDAEEPKEKKCADCRFFKSQIYHDLMWCRDCNSNHNHFEPKEKKDE